MNQVEIILYNKNIRITPMRQLILEFFLEKKTILGLSKLEEAFPHSDRITIYRTLKTFEEKGIIHSIANGTSEVKYALCPENCSAEKHLDKHPHFHCYDCGGIECLEEVLIPEISLPQAYQVQKVSMTFEGICVSCS